MNFLTSLFKRKKAPVEDLFDEKVVSIERYSKEAIHLRDSNYSGFSKIGGRPNLNNDFSWPYHNGVPLAFIAQLKFSEINKNSELPHYPKKGLLFVFYIQDQSTWGFDPKDKGSWVTHFLDNEDTSFSEIDFPDDLDEYSKYTEKRIVGNKIKTYPNWEDQRIVDLNLNDVEFDRFEELKENAFQSKPQHQLGGYANPQQSAEMYNECQLASNGLYCGDESGYKDSRAIELLKNADEWTLLLQIDSDDDTGMMWGDVGMLYFWIKKEDLKSCNFKNTWMILQCG